MKRDREKGFTLIEAMVTIVIVSVGLLAMASLLITGIRANAGSEARMDAASLAQSIVSRIEMKARALPYSQATANADAQAMLGSRYNAGGLAGGYNPVVVVSPTPVATGNFTSIIVRLQWDDHGQMKQVELRSGVRTN